MSKYNIFDKNGNYVGSAEDAGDSSGGPGCGCIIAIIILVLIGIFLVPLAIADAFASGNSAVRAQGTLMLGSIIASGILSNCIFNSKGSTFGECLALTYFGSIFTTIIVYNIAGAMAGDGGLALFLGSSIVIALACILPSLVIAAIAYFIYNNK